MLRQGWEIIIVFIIIFFAGFYWIDNPRLRANIEVLVTKRIKWVLGIGIGVILFSAFLNWSSIRTIHTYSMNAKGNLMMGEGLIKQADQVLLEGDKTRASLDAYEGIGYLSASSPGMNQMGVHGVAGISIFMNVAMFSLLGYSNPGQPPDTQATKKHYQRVIKVFIDSFSPFSRPNSSFDNHQIQQAINEVYQSMTPEERGQYEGWGP